MWQQGYAQIPGSGLQYNVAAGPCTIVMNNILLRLFVSSLCNILVCCLTDDLAELRRNGFWAAIITIGSYCYGEYFIASSMPPDPRQDTWVMMHSPVPHLIFSLLYIAGVTLWGPTYMSTGKPISGLRPYMMAYNAFQVAFSAYMFIEVGYTMHGMTAADVAQTFFNVR